MTVCMEPDLSPLTGVSIDTLKTIGIQSVQCPDKFVSENIDLESRRLIHVYKNIILNID